MATQLQDLTLKSLTEYTKDVVDWYELGFELEVDTIELDKIKRNYEYKGGEYCTSKMLEYWDLNCETSQEKVIAATKKVLEKQEREQEEQRELNQRKEKLQNEEKKILTASSQLQESLDCLDKEVKRINDKQMRLQDQQDGIKERWGRSLMFWDQEDKEWMREASANQQLSEAVANTEREESKAVIENFLQRRHLPTYTQLSAEAIETYAKEEIVNAEVKRSQQLKSRRNQIKLYAKNISELKVVIEKWRDFVKNHIESVKQKIVKAMEELGLKMEKISSINEQVQNLQSALEDLGSAITKSGKSLDDILAKLDCCDAELQKHIETFNSSYQQIIRSLTKLQHRIEITNDAIAELQKTIDKLQIVVGASTLGGTGIGTVIGSIGGPLGALVGAAIGAGVGFGFGAIVTDEESRRARRELQEKEEEKSKLEKELANNKKAQEKCQPTAKKAKEIIAMWAHLHNHK